MRVPAADANATLLQGEANRDVNDELYRLGAPIRA
jgi:hypothetical protein